MIGVAAGLALEGYRPVAHSYTPFLVERPYEQIKLDLGHQDLGAVLVSIGASYDASHAGRTHQAPEDVALVAALPGWTIHVPGHADEVEQAAPPRARRRRPRLHPAERGDERTRRSTATASTVLRRGSDGAPLVVAVGPTLDAALAATADLDVDGRVPRDRAAVRPRDGLRAALARHRRRPRRAVPRRHLGGRGRARARDRPHRLLALGVETPELRHYGTPAEHRAAHGLDAAGIRASIDELVPESPTTVDNQVRLGTRRARGT